MFNDTNLCIKHLYNNVVLSRLLKRRAICLSDLGNILAYYLDKTTLISLLY